MSNAPAWECQRSVDADVPVSFAWDYMTDISNWSDPPAEFSLDGPFAAGSCGTTRMPGQPANRWVIREVDPGRAYTIEGSFLEGALLLFEWRFDELSDRRTRMTQRIELHGENAATYIDGIRAGFEPHLEPGMRRIAESMAQAARVRDRRQRT
jgi:polyketide cyclase/dehydrase/lipid transport protein